MIKNLIKRLLRQRKMGKAWGYFLQILSQIGLVTQGVSLTLLIITTATVLQARGIMVPVWLIGLSALSIIGSAGLFVYKWGLPSFFSSWNQEFYKHDNPLRQDMEEMKKTLAEIQEKISK